MKKGPKVTIEIASDANRNTLESPKIVIEIPKILNNKIKVLQELMKKINQPVPSKQDVITAILTYETEWIDLRIEAIKRAVEAVAKV